jgi:hypothetical protein
METQKRSKKVLRNLINDSMRDAIRGLELPEPSSKVKKLLERSSKKLATVYAEILKKEEKKRKKADKLLKEAVNGQAKKKRKPKHDGIQLEEPVRI